MNNRTCVKCKKVKPESGFRKNRKWFRRTCIECEPLPDQEEQAQYHRVYMADKAHKAKLYRTRWLLKRPDYYEQYRKRVISYEYQGE